MLRTRRAEPQTEAQLFRDEFGAGMDHLRRAFGHARSMAGPRVRAMRDQWGPATGRLRRDRPASRRGWALPLGLVLAGTAVGAATAMVMRRQRRSWEEYDAELALEEITEAGPAERETGIVPDEERTPSTDQMPI